MRINARLDKGTQEKLQYLCQVTGQSTSFIVREAIDVYYASLKQSKNAHTILKNNQFIACGESESDLATNYKSYLNQSLNKHDHR